jgi:hypothetical protein
MVRTMNLFASPQYELKEARALPFSVAHIVNTGRLCGDNRLQELLPFN